MKRTGYDGSISVERKLELARKIRQEHQANQNIVRGRAAYLYGTQSNSLFALPEEQGMTEMSEHLYPISALKLRITAAMLLFGIFYTALVQNKSFMGVSVSQIYQAVEMDYSANLFDFMNEIPYTLHE